jgi:predicted nucleic acid-binding protein
LKWLIIVDTAILVIPTVTLNFTAEYFSDSSAWVRAFDVFEKIQLTWFSAQEFLISGIYIYETIRIIRISPQEDTKRHKILYQLLAINIVAICMDIALLVLEYLGLYFTQIIFKGLVYSIKLKMEFAVLGTLISLVHSGSSHGELPSSDMSTFMPR